MNKKRAIAILVALPVLIGWGYFGWIYSQDKTFEWEGMSRKYRLHRPLGDFTKGKRPLVIALHGYGDHPWFMEAYTGWSAKADREKFWVVYPYGTAGPRDANLSWNGGSCCGVASAENIDDMGFVNSLVTHLDKKYSIDLNRVYVVGLSNGALLAMRIAAENLKVAGVGVASGSVGGQYLTSPYYHLPQLTGPTNIFLTHGLKDKTVPYSGGLNWVNVARFEPFSQTVKYWVAANGCQDPPQLFDSDETIVSEYMCQENVRVKTVEVKSGSHFWPGGLLEWLSTGRLGDFSATDQMWGFFSSK